MVGCSYNTISESMAVSSNKPPSLVKKSRSVGSPAPTRLSAVTVTEYGTKGSGRINRLNKSITT